MNKLKKYIYIKIKLIFILFLIIVYLYYSLNKYDLRNKQKDFIKVCICTLGKKENKYIREFIEYYENYGIDKIFLYDNNDEDNERFEEVISDYIEKGFVTLFNWRGKKKQQINIFNHCYKNNYEKFDWLLFYDLDEYINLKNYNNIKDYLNEIKFNNCQVIYLNWIIHTDNNLIHYDNRSLHTRFPVYEQNAINNNKKFFIPVKSILKGHIPNIRIKCLHTLNSKLKACNGFGHTPKMFLYKMEPDFKYYFIDHFYFKSLEEFTDKLNRGSAIASDNIKIKLLKFSRYFHMNKINIQKLNYIENKTGIRISNYKKKLETLINKQF